MVNKAIDKRLRRIANVLLLNTSFSNNIGLLNGKMGVALFFFHYGRYTGNEIYKEYAGELIDEMYEEIHQNTAMNYADGLAGFGTGIEYLVQQGFIEADTDEVLADLDKQIHHHIIHHAPSGVDLCYGICGLGKYLIARLNHSAGKAETEATPLNKEHLALIVDRLEGGLDVNASLPDILSVIHFLSDVCSVNVNLPKATTSLNLAVEQLENTVSENIHFGTYPGPFNPLSIAMVLVQASEKTGIKGYAERGVHLLNTYEPDFRYFRENSEHPLAIGSLKLSLQYSYLGNQLNNNTYEELSSVWLSKALDEDPEALAGFRVGHSTDSSTGTLPCSPEGILIGYAGVGLILLTLSGGFSTDWLRLVPYIL